MKLKEIYQQHCSSRTVTQGISSLLNNPTQFGTILTLHLKWYKIWNDIWWGEMDFKCNKLATSKVAIYPYGKFLRSFPDVLQFYTILRRYITWTERITGSIRENIIFLSDIRQQRVKRYHIHKPRITLIRFYSFIFGSFIQRWRDSIIVSTPI